MRKQLDMPLPSAASLGGEPSNKKARVDTGNVATGVDGGTSGNAGSVAVGVGGGTSANVLLETTANL